MTKKIGDLTLHSVREISEQLDVTPATIRRYIKQDKLHGQKVGTEWYVPDESLREFFGLAKKPEEEKKVAG